MIKGKEGELNTDCMKACVDIFAMVQMLERVPAFSEEKCTTAANQQIFVWRNDGYQSFICKNANRGNNKQFLYLLQNCKSRII